MKTIADIKRKMTVGSKWSCLWSCREQSKDMGERFVGKVQSNSFGFINPITGNISWCDWPKKSEVEFICSNQFRINHGNISLLYTLVDSNNP